MIRPMTERNWRRTEEDFAEAMGLIRAGNSVADVLAWTGLSEHQLQHARDHHPFAAPVPNPEQIKEAAAMIRSDWSENERQSRCWGAREVVTIPQGVPVLADERDGESD